MRASVASETSRPTGIDTRAVVQVRVREADNARDLASAADETEQGPRTRAVYELTAVVAHIMGDAEEQDRLKKKRERAEPGKAEGHIIAHIKAGP